MEYREILRVEEKITKYEDLLSSELGSPTDRLYWSTVLGRLRDKLSNHTQEIGRRNK